MVVDHFRLDPALEHTSVMLGKLSLCQVRLVDDARWPWLLLVPEVPGAEEIHDLAADLQALVATETNATAKTLKASTACVKINSGALGNVVRQLHIHVVGRSPEDPNWPGPIWGFGEREAYDPAKRAERIRDLQVGLFAG